MKIGIVLGTRPEIIKLSPLIRLLHNNLNYFIIHTGQHYSTNMDKVFFEELELPQPKYNLEIGSKNHGEQTGQMLEKIEKIFIDEKPDLVMVLGDTNSVLAGALAATKLRIKVAHIEAGLRSYDKDMPEEKNRTIVDTFSDYLFVPTENSRSILLNEGKKQESIFVVGNTIVDAVQQNLEIADKKTDILRKLNLEKGNYFLLTLHRSENVDFKTRLQTLLFGLKLVAEEFNIPLIYPIHPRTKKRIEEFNIEVPNEMTLIEPQGYLGFLQLQKNAKLIITDSGGIQEESSILKVPCVTIRENTERPETLKIGSNVLAGTNPEKILDCVKNMLNKERNWQTPYGDGKAAQKIIEILKNENNIN